MKNRKNITLVFNHFEQEHLGKDVFLVPYYLGTIYNMDVTVVYPKTKTNRNLLPEIQGVVLKPVRNMFSKKPHSGPKILKEIVFLLYVIHNAKNIDVLMRFHLSDETVLIGAFYKWLNPNGFLYVKADGGYEFPNINLSLRTYNPLKFIKKTIRRALYKQFLNAVNLLTVETNPVYNQFASASLMGIALRDKTRLMYNGFDNEQFLRYNIKKNSFAEKENLIITVGRLGTRQKNTDMLLEAAENLDLKDWKIVLIGPIEKEECDFQKDIDAFFEKNPLMRANVIFEGPFYDKDKLWQWYSRAKIFVFPSRWESFGIVLTEALLFRNYIVSTDVGFAGEAIELGYGELIPQENASFLHKTLQRIIDENRLPALYQKVDWEAVDISWETCIKKAFGDILENRKRT
jgi:glycosyltransferase involved in cell wall biosynthesis